MTPVGVPRNDVPAIKSRHGEEPWKKEETGGKERKIGERIAGSSGAAPEKVI